MLYCKSPMDDFFASLLTSERVTAFINRFLPIRPQDGDLTVPGTTDGVLFMGILIVSIIIIPIISTRRRWMR